MFQKILLFTKDRGQERFCYFRQNLEGVQMKGIEERRQKTTPEKQERISLEEQEITAKKEYRITANTVYKNTGNFAVSLPKNQKEYFQAQTREGIFSIYGESKTFTIEQKLWKQEETHNTHVEEQKEQTELQQTMIQTLHSMPDSFKERGGRREEWNRLHPEVQEYEIYGGMGVPIDPMELLLGGGLKMAVTGTVKGGFMIMSKGKAFLSGVATSGPLNMA